MCSDTRPYRTERFGSWHEEQRSQQRPLSSPSSCRQSRPSAACNALPVHRHLGLALSSRWPVRPRSLAPQGDMGICVCVWSWGWKRGGSESDRSSHLPLWRHSRDSLIFPPLRMIDDGSYERVLLYSLQDEDGVDMCKKMETCERKI